MTETYIRTNKDVAIDVFDPSYIEDGYIDRQIDINKPR